MATYYRGTIDLQSLTFGGNALSIADMVGYLFTDTTQVLQLGTAAASGHSLVAGDVIVGGKLEVDGAAFFDSTVTFGGVLGIPDGLVGTPGLAFSADLDTGVWRPGTNTFAVSTGGVECFRLASTGYGTFTSPASADSGVSIISGSIANLRLVRNDATAQSWILRTDSDGKFKIVDETGAATTYVAITKATGATTVTGAATFSSTVQFNGVATHSANVLFSVDNTYDIGASGATRARDLWLARNASVGGTLGVSGTSTLVAVTASGKVLDTAATNPLHAQSAGQAVVAWTDAGNQGATVFLESTGNAVNEGGMVKFGSQGTGTWFAGIKGGLTDGSTNSKGYISLQTRVNASDTALTEQLRIDQNSLVAVTGTFSVASTSTFTGNATFSALSKHASGTAAAPPVTFTSDTASGFYLDATSFIGVSVAGAEVSRANNASGSPGWENVAFTSTASTSPAFMGVHAGGSAASPTATQVDYVLCGMFGGGYDNAGTPAIVRFKSAIKMFAAEAWTTTANGTYINLETTPIGSTTRAVRMRIDNNGFVGIGNTAPATALEVTGAITMSTQSSSGTPSITGQKAGTMIFDTANFKWWCYTGSAWKSVTLA